MDRSGTGGGPLRIARIESSSVLAVLAVFEHHRFALALFVPDGFLSRGVGLRVSASCQWGEIDRYTTSGPYRLTSGAHFPDCQGLRPGSLYMASIISNEIPEDSYKKK